MLKCVSAPLSLLWVGLLCLGFSSLASSVEGDFLLLSSLSSMSCCNFFQQSTRLLRKRRSNVGAGGDCVKEAKERRKRPLKQLHPPTPHSHPPTPQRPSSSLKFDRRSLQFSLSASLNFAQAIMPSPNSQFGGFTPREVRKIAGSHSASHPPPTPPWQRGGDQRRWHLGKHLVELRGNRVLLGVICNVVSVSVCWEDVCFKMNGGGGQGFFLSSFAVQHTLGWCFELFSPTVR